MESLVVEDLAEGDTVLGEVWDALHPGAALPAHLDFRMTDTGGAGTGEVAPGSGQRNVPWDTDPCSRRWKMT